MYHPTVAHRIIYGVVVIFQPGILVSNCLKGILQDGCSRSGTHVVAKRCKAQTGKTRIPGSCNEYAQGASRCPAKARMYSFTRSNSEPADMTASKYPPSCITFAICMHVRDSLLIALYPKSMITLTRPEGRFDYKRSHCRACLNKACNFFIHTNNKAPIVGSMRVCNPDCSSVGIHGSDTAPRPSRFGEIVSDLPSSVATARLFRVRERSFGKSSRLTAAASPRVHA